MTVGSLRIIAFHFSGPSGEPLLKYEGEDHSGVIKSFVAQAIEFYKLKGTLTNNSVQQIKAYSYPKSMDILSYPGKVTVCDDGSLIAIADSAHNRVLVTDASGLILVIIALYYVFD